MGAAWADEVARRDVIDLAGRIGLSTCPACGHTPSRGDNRPGRFGSVRSNGPLWTCYACQAGGSSLNLLSFVVLGRRRPLGSADWRRLETAARHLWAGLPVGASVQPVVERLSKSDRIAKQGAEARVAGDLADRAAKACGLPPEDSIDFFPSALHWVRSGNIAAAQLVADEIAAFANREARGKNV